MRIDIMDGDTVINTINADEVFAEQQHPGAWRIAAEQDGPVPTVTPQECTPAQGLVALYALKSITEQDVHDAIASIADPAARYTAQIAFARATSWRRASDTMQQLAALLGLSDADLDALFGFAVTVEV